jgi:hypothetical protein
VSEQFTKGQSKITDGIRGATDGLTHHSNTSRSVSSCKRMLVRQLRILVNEEANHRQVAGHLLGILRRESLQLRAYANLDIFVSNLIRN